MKARNTIKRYYAWILLTIFTSVLAIKNFHTHDLSYHGTVKAEAAQHAAVQEACFICDFNMHQADTPKAVAFVPAITVTLVERFIFTV